MRSTICIGTVDKSVKLFWPSSARANGAMRRPFSSTRVEVAPRPRSEMAVEPAAKPLPKPVGNEPAPSAVSVCRYSETVPLPDLSKSSRLMIWIGEAVSAVARLMLEPVISTRWTGASAGCEVCAIAGAAIRLAAATLPEKINRTERDITVSIIMLKLSTGLG
jgi:hypothetical protein